LKIVNDAASQRVLRANDDQVDALLLFLEWFADNETYLDPVMLCPITIVPIFDPYEGMFGPTPRHIDFTNYT